MADPAEEHALGDAEPSALFLGWRRALAEASRLGPIADLACGRGRHALPSARNGLPTLALDRNPLYLSELQQRARADSLPLQCLRCDLESDLDPPLDPGTCGAILVFCFLHRALAGAIQRLLAPGGLLLYETFTREQIALARGPRNPAFLLEPGELPQLFPALEVLHYAEGVRARSDGRRRALAALAARRPG